MVIAILEPYHRGLKFQGFFEKNFKNLRKNFKRRTFGNIFYANFSSIASLFLHDQTGDICTYFEKYSTEAGIYVTEKGRKKSGRRRAINPIK